MIKISVISYDNEMVIEPLSAVFGPSGGSMGRGSDNGLILPDPKCHISRRQASIKSDGRRHSIMNLSQVSPIWINGKKTELAVDAELQFGDEIKVGLYLLRAESPFGAAPAVDSEARNGAFVSPFARDLSQSASVQSSQQQADAMPLELSQLSVEDSEHFADILDGVTPEAIAAIITPEPIAAISKPAAKPAMDLDEFDVPELNSIFAVEPAKALDSAKTAQVSNLHPATASHAEIVALTQAFLRGAKLSPDSMPTGITTEWMEALGAFAASATQNVVEQLAALPTPKQQVDPDSTNVLGANNPLKFLPSARSALLQMFGAAVPGFMSPAEAIDDANVALQTHQRALKAGLRAMLEDTLARLDPAMLEEQIKARPVIDSMMAANRKAKCWALYGELFKDVCDEARDDDKILFGEQFMRAYEREMKRCADESTAKKKSA